MRRLMREVGNPWGALRSLCRRSVPATPASLLVKVTVMMTIKGLLKALELAEPTARVVFDFCDLNVDPHLTTDVQYRHSVLSWGPRVCTVADLRVGLNDFAHRENTTLYVGPWGSPTHTTVRFARGNADLVTLVTA